MQINDAHILPDLVFQYFLYSIHAPTAMSKMHAMVAKIEPATAPLQLPASAIVEPTLSIFGDQLIKDSPVFETDL